MNEILDIEKVQELANIHITNKIISMEDINSHIKDAIRVEFHFKYPNGDFDKAWDNQKEIACFSGVLNNPTRATSNMAGGVYVPSGTPVTAKDQKKENITVPEAFAAGFVCRLVWTMVS